MVKFVCWEGPLIMRAELNSVAVIFGEQYAVLGGT